MPLSPGNDNATLSQIAAAMPQPASTMPPGVGVDSAKGSDTQKFALADHTHATSVQRVRMTLTAGQVVRWTFAKPYEAGVVPIVTATAQNITTPTAATQPFVVNTAGPATNEYVDIMVFQGRAVPQNLATLLLGAVYSLFTAPAGAVVVNLQAAKPTQ